MTTKTMGAALALAAGLSAGQAGAGEVPLYKPAPAWVKPAPPIDAAKLTDDSPILLTYDAQQRLAGGEVWSYQDVATRLASPEVVAQAGTLSFAWRPAKGDIVVHKVEIIRGAEHIDALAGGRTFTVLRREQQLEQRALDGQLTATLAVEGLRVGDVLHVTMSTTAREPAFGQAMQTAALIPAAPVRTGFVRARMLWPRDTDVRWRTYADGAKPVLTPLGDDQELVLTGALPKPADLPDDAPLRYRRLPIIEASSFAGWEAVSRANAPLYDTDGLIAPGSELAKEIARIAAASADPRARAAAALELVQDKVRYLFNGMENGNYQPQTPAQTWSLRYGDCKAKTLLLLSLLRGLGIEAEPVLASAQLGDLVPDRLPSAGAFDHVLVRASVNGETLWLDGTGSGARVGDLADAPPLRNVLPLRPAGAGLMAVPLRAPAQPNVAVSLDIDQSAGLLLPSLVHGEIRLRGPMAEMVGLARTQGSAEQQRQMVSELMNNTAGTSVTLARYSMTYDRAAGEATVIAEGIGQNRWRKENGRYRVALDRAVADIQFTPDRSRAAWAAIPVATGNPETVSYRTRLRLPGNGTGFATEGDGTDATPMPGMSVRRSVSLKAGDLVVDERVERSGTEIAPADLAAARASVARARQRVLTGIAPADVPARWQVVSAPGAGGAFKPLLAAYAAAIAQDPSDRDGYLNRARFLAGIYDRKAALVDMDKAAALQNDADVLLERAALRRELGQEDAAAADYRAVLAIDPESFGAMSGLAQYDLDHGRRDPAMARVQERVDAGGKGRADFLSFKASLLTRAGDRDAALAAADEAIAARPGDADLLNDRCWTKAQLNVQLDTALKDCTKAIELAENPASILDSRALVYFRMGRMEDALSDADAALDLAPDQAATLYVRGLIRQKQGDTAAAARDLAAARLIAPRIDEDYRRMGLAG